MGFYFGQNCEATRSSLSSIPPCLKSNLLTHWCAPAPVTPIWTPAVASDAQICSCTGHPRSPWVAGSRLLQHHLWTEPRNTLVQSCTCLGPLWWSPQTLFPFFPTDIVVDTNHHLIIYVHGSAGQWFGRDTPGCLGPQLAGLRRLESGLEASPFTSSAEGGPS